MVKAGAILARFAANLGKFGASLAKFSIKLVKIAPAMPKGLIGKYIVETMPFGTGCDGFP